MSTATARVARRHVFYVPGYDPRGPRTYFLLFKRELARWAERNGVKAALSRAKGGERPGLSTWRLISEGPDYKVETTIDFLAWDDLSEREFRMGYARRFVAALEVLSYTIVSGLFASMVRWNWKFGLFAAYPWVMALGYTLIAFGWTGTCLLAATRTGPMIFMAPISAVICTVGLWFWWKLIKRLEPKLYVFYLINDWIWTARHRRRRDPDAEARFEAFAERVAEVADVGAADELLIVGHSSGSFVGAIVAARAVELSANVGERAPLNFLTIGANTVVSCAGRGDNPGRRAIASLLWEPRVHWLEYYTPNDVMSFPHLDYPRCYGINPGERPQINPVSRSARMAEIFTEETWRRLDWRFFEKHFQFIRANERPGEYDFYRFLSGPARFGSAVLEQR